MAKAHKPRRAHVAVAMRAKAKWRAIREKYSDTPHRSFRLTPRVKRKYSLQGVKEAWLLIIETLKFIRENAKIMLGLATLYGILTYLMVGGVSQIDYAALRQSSEEFLAGGLDRVTTALSYFGAALTGGLNEAPNELQQLTAAVLTLLFWLILIWAVRMVSAGKAIKIRDALYNGPTPFLSTLVLLAIIALQLIPAALGLFAFTVAVTDQWISSGVEGAAFGAAAALLCLLSLYWLTGSIIALNIVALPGMYPFQAFATARTLVTNKRWSVVLRVISLFVVQLIVAAVVLIPVFMLDSWLKLDWLPLVPLFIQIVSSLALTFSVVYIYKLYRSLL